ncbi:SARP family transcriptional regulator [Lentzea sp. PSKA42]|uniref:SARP family transcriptional regulator n=1 Tax=Lentzea indica TaxID=2604800 RepID=A0ABX1FDX6_9PSEU|nr:BTAD domain-containing putative transcriptional regulator [Lentzea indica]NKE57042.1 SARP family transcriptional regulator [Lentzea indica]
MGGTEFRLLGAVGVWSDGMPVDLGHGRRRCVLAALLVDANQVVSAEGLMERAWGENAPRQGKDTLYAYVSRLRNVFRRIEGAAITRKSGGYVLTVDPAAVDLHEFHRLLAEGRAADGTAKLALLDQALALWQGEAFAELDTPWLDNVRQELAKERFAAELDRIDLQLGLGRHGELLTELAAATRRHPLDERLTGQFMLALYRSGRQAEALSAYQRLRDRLSDELGVDPWPELQRLHTSILRQDPGLAPPAVRAVKKPMPAHLTAQLPPPVPHFSGRHDALRELDTLLGLAAPVVISAVAGTGGVGKTALAVQWAHQHADDFPDGQLYVNLRGYDVAEPMTPNAALEGFLRTLGFDPAAIPSTVDERSALFRSALAGRRMLVLLDNARSADQVRPLLPGRHGCVALVTSRDDLAGLVARDGAHRLRLERLSEREAVELLRQVLGANRVAAEPAAALDLARRCALLPLALRVAAERAVRRDDVPLAELVTELEDLDVPGDPASAVRVVFSWSYLALPGPAGRLFRLLGLHPGPDFDTAAAAWLAGTDVATARRLLDVLRSAHLVEQTTPDRFQLHDLLRMYARELAERHDDAAERAGAVRRMAIGYLHTAYRAADQVNPAMLHLPRPEFSSDDPADGLGWLETERRNLVAVIRHTATTEDRRLAWRLADALRGFFWLRKYHDDWLAALSDGLRAARFGGDLMAQAAMHHGIATARREPQPVRARDRALRARQAVQRTGWLARGAGRRAGQPRGDPPAPGPADGGRGAPRERFGRGAADRCPRP